MTCEEWHKSELDKWFQLATDNFEVVLRLIQKYHPAYWNEHYQEIRAHDAENICEQVRMTIRKRCLANPAKMAEDALAHRNGSVLWQIFQDTWWGMPESETVRNEKGFFVLCDLCSEYPGNVQ